MPSFDPVSAVAGVVGKVLDRVLPEDKAQKEAANLAVLQLVQSGELAQMANQAEINKAEAQTGNMFIAGWRPFVGWVCGIGLLSQFIVRPVAMFVANLTHHPVDFPNLDMGTLMVLLTGMLGLTAARTAEKMQNVEANR